MRRWPGKLAAFTLTEMAVVLVIVALLLGGMIMPLTARREMHHNEATRRQLLDVRDALIGFAAINAADDGLPYLPCPDTDNDGIENRSGTACSTQQGDLPWADLGLGRQDIWGNRLRYRVAANFSDSGNGFSLLSDGDLRICESQACSAVLAKQVPAVIVSFGSNGAQQSNNADEQENRDDDTDFVERIPLVGANGYDDITFWLPHSLLLSRMVVAGRLP